MKNFSFVKDLKHLEIAKSYNTLKSIRQEAKQSRISYIPPRFALTLTNRCNLRCPTCLYVLTGPELFDNSGLMRFEDYKSILDKYNKYIKGLTLTGGEVTLHPEMEKIHRLCQIPQIESQRHFQRNFNQKEIVCD